MNGAQICAELRDLNAEYRKLVRGSSPEGKENKADLQFFDIMSYASPSAKLGRAKFDVGDGSEAIRFGSLLLQAALSDSELSALENNRALQEWAVQGRELLREINGAIGAL